ncbi:MAG TPA: helix-turn-helix domain-containing protein [Thermoanaerobacter sp.]|nr:helix-turn-helix domain-containing protein [Thermoanaerobacter sp.]
MDKIAYSVKEIAEILQINRYTVYEWIKRNKMPHNRTAKNGKILVPASAIEEWLQGVRLVNTLFY